MTLKQLVARVMRALPSTRPDRWGESDIVDMLNSAQDELAVLSRKYTEQESELEAGYSTIALPDDLLKIVTVYWGDLTKRELYPEMGEYPTSGEYDEESTGYPSKYYLIDRTIEIRPIPTVDSYVNIVYVNKPSPMSKDTDVPDYEAADEALIAYALRQIHMEAGSKQADMWDARYQRERANWLATDNANFEIPFKVDGYW